MQLAIGADVFVIMKKLVYAAAIFALGLALAYNWYFTLDYVHVDIDKGILRGFAATTWTGTKYFTFKGIRYAQPPIGELRFKGPVEETAWVGVRDAISHGSVCPHVDIAFDFFRGQEDCLFLNVFTPSLAADRMPVMVWIHGGGFSMCSGDDDVYGPDYFMGSGVVLVTMNYRLGALGFLSTEDDDAPGNAGMKDQVAALRWVRRNIAKFGGDPENVTIFGGSSGAACVHYHLLSPMSSGLFVRAISQSGSALETWTLSDNPADITVRLAEGLGAKDVAGDTVKALEFLKTVPHEDIVRIQGTLKTPAEERMRVPFLFAPSVEKGVKSEEVFLPDSPQKLLESGRFNRVPYITGFTSHESYFLLEDIVNPESMNAAIKDTERYVPIDIKNQELRNDLAKSIRKFYFDDKPIANENISNLVDLYTDTTFVLGTEKAARIQLKTSDAPVYFFVFSYDGGLNLIKLLRNINLPGAAHGDELGYMFYHNLVFWRKPAAGSDDEYVLHTMIRLWTNFAKYGDPTPAGDSLTWEPVTNDKFNYLNISGRNMELSLDPNSERFKFWRNAYERNAAFNTH